MEHYKVMRSSVKELLFRDLEGAIWDTISHAQNLMNAIG